MESINYLEKARSRYTDQHSDDPVFDIIIQLLITQQVLNQDVVINLEEILFDIDKSYGLMLDLIGYNVGQDRIIEGNGEFFGFNEDVSALGYGDINDPEAGGYWYSLYNGNRSTITTANDELYRRLIKARIIYNNNMATPETLLRILNILTNTTTSRFTEDGKGNITIFIENDDDYLVTYFLSIRESDRNIIPIPLGVSVGLQLTG